ncbi:MAG: bifunctional hydroxymethylpyrimidine kinase/phosphomethylpyrimidine kinase [Leptospiraceae bacterium]|nr:bifunctional hydroxymethylpyrimidine kinase/phosphomethylpyrimidine kinase [Leptospiraceae bacterium]
MSDSIPVVLTIAGSDSGGGAGIQADLKTFQAFACFGTTAITAITCQNTTGVSGVQAVDPEIVAGQLHDVLIDFPIAAAKTGMLFSAPIIRAIQHTLKQDAALSRDTKHISDKLRLVVDPVMVASSGDRLLQRDAEEALIAFMRECAALITPNLPEAEVILNKSISDVDEAALELFSLTGACVLIKGGHRLAERTSANESIDVFYDGRDIHHISRPVLSGRNTHGTGCTLSAAIAAELARGTEMHAAIESARDYLHGAMQHAPGLGKGIGPLNHMWRDSI